MKTGKTNRQSDSLKLWIELIRCSNMLGQNMDKKFRQNFGQNISRFDVLSQLERETEFGLTVGDLGQRLIASKGNITGLVNRMTKDGLVTKEAAVEDKRCFRVKISSKGLVLFEEMAENHALWIAESFSSLNIESIQKITSLLGETRNSLALDNNKNKNGDE